MRSLKLESFRGGSAFAAMNTEPTAAPKSMTASTIVLIVLRLFALDWMMQGVVMASSFTISAGVMSEPKIILIYYCSALLVLATSIALWFLAPRLGRWVVGKQDSVAQISGLTLEDLYSFAFLFLGLYFVLTSFAASINWVHYFLSVNGQTTGRMPPQDRQNLYQLSQHLVTLIAGFAAMLPSRRWAQKLIRLQEKKP